MRLAAQQRPGRRGGADLVLFCVKSTDTEAVYARDGAAPRRGRTRHQPAERRRERARRCPSGRQRVVPAVVYVGTAMPEPGLVSHQGRGDLVIGPLERPRTPGAAIARSCRRHRRPVRTRPRCRCVCRPTSWPSSGQADGELRLQRDLGAGAVELRQARRGGRGRRAAGDGGARSGRGRRGRRRACRSARRSRRCAADRRRDAGAAVVDGAGHGARQAERDRPPERFRRPARTGARRADAGQPGAARAGQAGRVGAGRR